MRDLELRGAGDLLGDEQSGHVAAIGFELYVALLDEAVEALRAAEGDGEAARPRTSGCASTSRSTPTCRASTCPSRRRRSTSTGGSRAPRDPGELRALRAELRDRFGPLPDPVANLLELQRGADRLRPRRRPHGRGPRRAARGDPGRARLGRGRAPARAGPGGDLRVARRRRSRCGFPTSPPSASRPCSSSRRR